MTTRKSTNGKAGAKELKVKKQTLKDLDPKSGKKVAGGLARGGPGTNRCGGGGGGETSMCTAFTYCGACATGMTYCGQITCVKG